MPAAYEFSPTTVEPADPRVAGGAGARRQPPVRHRLGAGQRELGRARPGARPAQQQDLVRALYHLTKAVDPHPAGDRQRRLGAARHRRRDRPRLHRERRRCCASATATGRRWSTRWTTRSPRTGSCCCRAPCASDAPVVISEFGGISLDVDAARGLARLRRRARRPSSCWSGYAELVGALMASPAVAGFCWTQLTDTQQERNGLLRPRTASRRCRSRRSAR